MGSLSDQLLHVILAKVALAGGVGCLHELDGFCFRHGDELWGLASASGGFLVYAGSHSGEGGGDEIGGRGGGGGWRLGGFHFGTEVTKLRVGEGKVRGTVENEGY